MNRQSTLGIWRGAAPATEATLQALLAACAVSLPNAYLDQLRSSNGGEGDLALEPRWIAFWSAEEVVDLNDAYAIAELLPGFFGFGSNGGGELLAFKIQQAAPWPIYMIPFMPMERNNAIQIASDFAELQRAIGYTYPDAV